MINQENLEQRLVDIYQYYDPIAEGDETQRTRRLSDDEMWEASKDQMIENIKKLKDGEDYINVCSDEEPEKFEEARLLAIKFINEL